jgi:hypothetical protein
MTSDGFLRRLRVGKSVNCVYRRERLTGLIAAWPYEDRFVLTWEECPEGQQYDESTYTRDERHLFGTAEEVLAFAEQRGFPATVFGP